MLEVELHKVLYGKDKIKPNKWEKEFLKGIWSKYLNVGKFDRLTHNQREKIREIIKKYRTNVKRVNKVS